MYQRWNIPRNICFQYPISRDTTELFVGRKDQIDLLRSRLTKNAVVLLEGIIGAGKTSFGNFVRFTSKEQFSPSIEIRSEGSWNKEDFMLNIIGVIVDELENGKTFKIKNKKLDEIILNYKNFFLNSYNFGFGAGNAMAQGNLNFGNTKSYHTTTNHSAAQIESDLKEIAVLINQSLNFKKPIIIQLNNLDLDDGFTQEQMKNLFNSIRDVLLFENFSWILTGKEGIYSFLKKNVKKAYEIITQMEVDELSGKDLSEIFQKRSNFEGRSGTIPMNEYLLQKIYFSTGGSFRKTFVLIDELLSYYENVPMKNEIKEEDVSNYFMIKKVKDFERINQKENWNKVLKVIQNNEGINQQELSLKVNKTQPYISKLIHELVDNQFCRVEKKSQTSHYYLMNEFVFLKYS